MPRITVGEPADHSGLWPRLEREARLLQELGLAVELTRCEEAGRAFYTLEVRDDRGDAGDTAELLRVCVALAVSETVLQEIEPRVLEEIVQKMRPAFSRTERDQVLERARRLASGLEADASSERRRVMERAAAYLGEHSLLLVDGFVRFRLREYCDELMDCVRQAVDDHEFEKERIEFIALLKDFVDGRPEGVREVHVLPSENQPFRLVDPSGFPVETSYLHDFAWELADDGPVDMEELLIATLVSLAPGKVVCHRPIQTQDVPLVQGVFQDRIAYCSGCPLCQGPATPTARPRVR